MKKFLILCVFSGMLFFTGCSNISNIDIQKLNQKAIEYMEAGDYERAIARLESILDLNPNYTETYYNLGVAYYQMNDYEKAVEALNTAIDKKDNFADAYYSRAVVYEDWAYSILEGENVENPSIQKKVTNDDKDKSLEFLKNAKSDFEKYLEHKRNAKDKEEVHEKLVQIENDLSNVEPVFD